MLSIVEAGNDRRIVIWGASGHALVVADILRLRGFEVVAFVDEIDTKRHGEAFAGADVIGVGCQLQELQHLGVSRMAMGIGNNEARVRSARRAKGLGFQVVSAFHPTATVAGDVRFGEGTVVAAGAVVNPACRLGSNVLINTAASIDHECVLEDGVHIAPGTHLAGRVLVGQCTIVGVGSAVKDGVRIGAFTVLGAGSVVVSDLPDNCLAYGCPARAIPRNSES